MCGDILSCLRSRHFSKRILKRLPNNPRCLIACQQLRHHDKASLEALQETPAFIVQKLRSSVPAPVYAAAPGTTARTTFSKRDLVAGRCVCVSVCMCACATHMHTRSHLYV